MSDDIVKETVAYRVCRQIVDHVYGSEEKLSSEEFLQVYRIFHGAGGSWEGVIRGDLHAVNLLEGALDRFMRWRNTWRVAVRVAAASGGQYRSP